MARWSSTGASALDQMEHAHRTVGRRAAQQLNQAYLVLLSSHFQLFCRDLHTETVDLLLRNQPPSTLPVIRLVLLQARKLDSGNPNAGNLGADFGRLGMAFWPEVKALHRCNPGRHAALEQMAVWRNAIAHQDFTSAAAKILNGRATIRLAEVRRFRRACDGFAIAFDAAALAYINTVVGPHSRW